LVTLSDIPPTKEMEKKKPIKNAKRVPKPKTCSQTDLTESCFIRENFSLTTDLAKITLHEEEEDDVLLLSS
jgi:hypothetical protein